jgi:uncharacterized protein (DUF1015 family)
MASENRYSFLHVVKPEIDLPPDTDPYSDIVYETAAKNIKWLRDENILMQDETDCYYLYQLQMNSHIQTGLVAVASVQDYDENRIKKHEFTRPVKENDRTKHILTSRAQTGPVFCIYKSNPELRMVFGQVMSEKPEVSFSVDDGVKHSFWKIDDKNRVEKITSVFGGFQDIYIADGHHRSAAGSRAAKELCKLNTAHTGKEEYNYFLTVIFPDDEMQILPYNRVIKDLNGITDEQFMARLAEVFQIETIPDPSEAEPDKPYTYAMYMNGAWHRLTYSQAPDPSDPVESLDVQVLAKNVLDPILGIDDPRTNPRIDFIGGIRGLGELEQRVDSGKWKVAFALHPTSIDQLLNVADANKVMPPKSTWFEPKLRSGMVIHLID